jgi:hypothetical protein
VVGAGGINTWGDKRTTQNSCARVPVSTRVHT